MARISLLLLLAAVLTLSACIVVPGPRHGGVIVVPSGGDHGDHRGHGKHHD